MNETVQEEHDDLVHSYVTQNQLESESRRVSSSFGGVEGCLRGWNGPGGWVLWLVGWTTIAGVTQDILGMAWSSVGAI